MLAKRLPTILPDLSSDESIETTRIYSVLGRLKPGQPLLATRPYRGRTIRSATPAWWAAGRRLPQARSVLLIMGSCFSTSCRVQPPHP